MYEWESLAKLPPMGITRDKGLQDSCARGCIDTPDCAVFLYCNSTVACTAAGGMPHHPFCSQELLAMCTLCPMHQNAYDGTWELVYDEVCVGARDKITLARGGGDRMSLQ